MSAANNTGWFSEVNPVLNEIARRYWSIHPYSSLTVCAFGIVTNVFNIVTLTRPHMRNSINCILTGIAISDIVTMASYVPFIGHFYLDSDVHRTPEKNAFAWIVFMYVHEKLSASTHNASIWLAVFLAILRYRSVKSHVMGQVITNRATIAYISLIFVASFFILIPMCITSRLIPIYGRSCDSLAPTNASEVCYEVISTNVPLIFYIYGITGKLVPCFLITSFGGLLLRTLRSTQRRSEKLVSRTNRTRMKQHSRTTKMLLAVIVMFLITELPQGVILVMSASSYGFLTRVYPLLGDILDMLALLNNSVNFLLYCTMSQQYRQTFTQLVCPKFVSNPQTSQTTETIALRSNLLTNGQ